MMKIANFKTECIKKLTKMMQKWMQNWELKQQVLVSLCTQFAAKSEEMGKTFIQLENQMTLDKELI